MGIIRKRKKRTKKSDDKTEGIVLTTPLPSTPLLKSNKPVYLLLEMAWSDLIYGRKSKSQVLGYVSGLSKHDLNKANDRYKHEWAVITSAINTWSKKE